MSKLNYFNLPLFGDASYSYDTVIERVSYTFSFYYNTVMKAWIYGISYTGGEDIISGRRLVPHHSLTERYPMEWSGYLTLLPIGKNREETISNPYELYKYYKLYYVAPRVEEGDGGEE